MVSSLPSEQSDASFLQRQSRKEASPSEMRLPNQALGRAKIVDPLVSDDEAQVNYERDNPSKALTFLARRIRSSATSFQWLANRTSSAGSWEEFPRL